MLLRFSEKLNCSWKGLLTYDRCQRILLQYLNQKKKLEHNLHCFLGFPLAEPSFYSFQAYLAILANVMQQARFELRPFVPTLPTKKKTQLTSNCLIFVHDK